MRVVRVAVAQAEFEDAQQAKLLADRMLLPLLDSRQFRSAQQQRLYDYFLVYENSTLGLRSTDPKCPGVLSVDFSAATLKYRVKNSIRSQNIVKAIGIKSVVRLKVLDATAGLGKDAFLLASLGCEMLLLERSAIVHALLQDGLKRAAQNNDETAMAVAKMNLLCSEFMEFDAGVGQFDVVYLDPMFPPRRKSAKVKKEVALLQQLLGHEADNANLLEHALLVARKRVVVKRAKLSPHLGSVKPDIEYKGSSSRYDVYLTA